MGSAGGGQDQNNRERPHSEAQTRDGPPKRAATAAAGNDCGERGEREIDDDGGCQDGGRREPITHQGEARGHA